MTGCLEHLYSGGAEALPGLVEREVEQPGVVRLAVIRVGEAEKIAADEMPGGVLASLREVPPEVRLVDRPEAQERGGRYGAGEDGRPRHSDGGATR